MDIYIHTNTPTYTCVYTYTYVRIYIHISKCFLPCMYVCMYRIGVTCCSKSRTFLHANYASSTHQERDFMSI